MCTLWYTDSVYIVWLQCVISTLYLYFARLVNQPLLHAWENEKFDSILPQLVKRLQQTKHIREC